MTDEIDAVEVEIVIPRALAEALEQVYDERVSSLSSGRRDGWDSEELSAGADDLDVGGKVVRLAVDGHISKRAIKRAIRDGREDSEPDGLRYV